MPAHANTCQVCGAIFHAKPSKARKFCGHACAAQSKVLDRIERLCLQCGTTFEILASRLKYGGDYCSEACSAAVRRVPLADRFWTKVDKNGPIPAHCPQRGPCWMWTASCNDAGYGMIGLGNGKIGKAHRVAFELTYGAILPGLDLCHHCDNPTCVRPSHMFPGTRKDNIQDAYRKGRKGAHRQQFARGEQCGQSVLTEAAVRDIRQMRAQGMTHQRIADYLGVTRQTVSDVLRGATWRHVA